ncbi:MAG: hypothetical protein RLZ44_80 [Pseudomonadota bacterium]
MNVLVLNCGSSSVKFSIIDADRDKALLSGAVEGIGEPAGRFRYSGAERATGTAENLIIQDHRQALELVLERAHRGPAVDAIGHRVVHGGAGFRQPALVDRPVLEALRELDHLAPLHNPGNRLGIAMAMELLPEVPQVAVFDTAFHATLPEHAYRYAVPETWFLEHGVRRYGFHGISHQSIVREAARLLGRPPASLNLVSLHLGNGASAAAIQGGCCVDTSMGMTPLEGLVMGTRPGDLDPGVLLHLLRRGLDLESLERQLNQASGLRGLCGENDMREVHRRVQAGDPAAVQALDIFCYRVRKYLGAYYAVLGRVDAVVFTGGIGEHDPQVRAAALQGLEGLGVRLDAARNRQAAGQPIAIQASDSAVALLVIPTREEQEIALQVQDALRPEP